MQELQYLTEDEYYKAIGEQCQKIRDELNISVKEMIKQTGLSRSLLYEFETKGKKISAYRLNKVLRTLNLPTIDDSFRDEIAKKKVQFTLSGDGLGDLAALPNGEKKTLLNILTTLLGKTPDILNKTISDVIDQNIEEDRQIREEALTRKHTARQTKTNQA